MPSLRTARGLFRRILPVATVAALIACAGLPSATVATASSTASQAAESIRPAAAARSYPATIADARTAVADLMKDPALSSVS